MLIFLMWVGLIFFIVMCFVWRKMPRFLMYVAKDIYYIIKHGRHFNEYGVSVYCGRQGAGKTIAMVEYLERMRRKYPKCMIITNFDYKGQNRQMISWKEIFEVRNGEDGVIFAIDEIQNEYNSLNWKSFPEGLLSEVTQQRKQKIKIVCTSQVFTRVVKQLREQAFDVIECYTILGRWTLTRCFDADDYNSFCDNPSPELKKHLKRKYRYSFIQTDEIRGLYDTWAKVQKMVKEGFIDRELRAIK